MMSKKLILRLVFALILLAVLIRILISVLGEFWVRKKIAAILTENNSSYNVEIDKIQISLNPWVINLTTISFTTWQEDGSSPALIGEIKSIKFKGIKLAKALLKDDIHISEVYISGSFIEGNIALSEDAMSPIISSLNLKIGNIIFEDANLELKNKTNYQSYSVIGGNVKIQGLQIKKLDTLTPLAILNFDFEAEKLSWISTDSINSYTAICVNYSAGTNIVSLDSFSVRPNYSNYAYTAHFKYQKFRIEADFSNVNIYGFSVARYFKYKSLVSSYIEIGTVNMKVFRDKRKEFHHINKLAFQDMIYTYPDTLQIDSIKLLKGNVNFTEHVKEASQPGWVNFNDIHANIYKITNNPIYKTQKDFLELKVDALLMGKGKINILLKARLFDLQNTFIVNGSLAELEFNELNPMLENNAFIYATSGKVEAMNFSFVANNTKATGEMIIWYKGLKIAVKNRETNDTTAIRERITSFIVNQKIIDSNPIAGEAVRVGTIDYQRDPERFLFHYCFRSILTGLKSSVAKNPNN